MSERAPYSRVYWSIIDDDDFHTVYDDDRHLATWLRLLLIADQAWPASAHMPSSARRQSVQALEDCGLIVVTNKRYRLRGLDAERDRRSQSASQSAASRWSRDQDAIAMRSQPSRIPVTDASRDEPRQDEPRRADASTGETYRLLEELTGRTAGQAGERQLSEFDRHFTDYPPARVEAAYRKAAKAFDGPPTARQLVWAVRNILEPFAKPDDIRKLEERERADAEREASHRRVEATRRRAEELQRAAGE